MIPHIMHVVRTL